MMQRKASRCIPVREGAPGMDYMGDHASPVRPPEPRMHPASGGPLSWLADRYAEFALWIDEGVLWFVQSLRDMDPSTAMGAVLGVLLLCGMGAPIPEDIILISAGFLSALGKFHLSTAIFASMLGVLSGDAVMFMLGRRYGRGVFELPLIRRWMTPAVVKKAERRIQANARFICFMARFMPGLRSPIYITAGALQVPPRVYFTQDLLAASISVPLWVWFGWYFGEEIENALLAARDLQVVVVTVAVLAVVAYVVWEVRKHRALREEDDEAEVPPGATADEVLEPPED